MTTTQYAFSFDVSRCSGCMACMVACFDQNDLPGSDDTAFRHVIKVEKDAYPIAAIRYVSLSCMHCGDAPCIAVCPVGALSKENTAGAVMVDPQLCLGCHACATVCPFGAPQFPEGKTMAKCELCLGRILNGQEPACVRTCTTKALGFGPIGKLTEDRARRAANVIVSAFNPHLLIKG